MMTTCKSTSPRLNNALKQTLSPQEHTKSNKTPKTGIILPSLTTHLKTVISVRDKTHYSDMNKGKNKQRTSAIKSNKS